MIIDTLVSLLSLYFIVTIAAVVHVVLNKRDSRAALGWAGLVILFPYAGVLLYLMFGINRIHRKARRISLQVEGDRAQKPASETVSDRSEISRVGLQITQRPVTGNASISTYTSGEEAYPEMLDAIDSAQREVLLSTYIFDNDETGREFISRLRAASARGVDVRLLVDDIGIRYSFPSIIRELKNSGLDYRRFMPLRLFPPSFSINLRTHRKLLLTDRACGFVGGMNIGDRQLVNGPSPHRASDLHFRVRGPVVEDFAGLFAEDWEFCGGEALQPLTAVEYPRGRIGCRLVADGPDENLDALLLLIIGAISCATRRIWIMTPYFLPEQKLRGALQAASLSGVDVQVMIPQKNNWPLVQWALQHNMHSMLDHGIRILQRPPPFAHSKCLIIDYDYSLIGSTNLDPRSLRLNFELGVEVFDQHLNHELALHFEQESKVCIPFTQEFIRNRGVIARLRDGAAAMFGPYL